MISDYTFRIIIFIQNENQIPHCNVRAEQKCVFIISELCMVRWFNRRGINYTYILSALMNSMRVHKYIKFLLRKKNTTTNLQFPLNIPIQWYNPNSPNYSYVILTVLLDYLPNILRHLLTMQTTVMFPVMTRSWSKFF